ncbi:YitT family protein [Clostridium sp. PL3]|uniref:YitT family protein n=1 Tax=Clostridium thailandense TaxID=2794346 RepID=A0A949WSI1_9CLOT|nr:YitT family protein [Clostridium thailandense]MBV7275106.1 YitT family protein [Clostridium thailandense]
MFMKKENLLRVLMVIAGSLIYSIGVNLFIIPHKLLSGGVAGIAIILQYLTGMQSGYFIILINIPIFLIGIRAIDKEFGIFSFIGMASMSLSLIFTRNLHNLYYIPDPLAASLCGGLLTGLGAGIIFKSRASQGGTDIIAVVVKKKYGMSIGKIAFMINAVIVAMGMVIGNLQVAVYTLIAMYMNAAIVDKFIQGFDKEKVVFIVTGRCDKVKQAILENLGRGVTYLYGEGAYTGDKKKVIYCILSPKELEEAKHLVENIDSSAVVSIMDTAEVRGKGFKAAAF